VNRGRAAGLVVLVIAALAAAALAWSWSTAPSVRTVDSPFDRFPGPDGGPGPGGRVPGAPDPDAGAARFVAFVFADVQRTWKRRFERAGVEYEPAGLVIFREAVRSGCGTASSTTGPFYCALDRRVYLDLGFFKALAVVFHAPGDFAQAYVIAHEVAHHVQALTGVTEQVTAAASEEPSLANELSILLELQADCLAGVWAHTTYERGLLERGDLEEGLAAAAAVGDDRIQAHTTGRIDRETWTHGSSEQRVSWFVRGFESGRPADCDTFEEGPP
jgi:predicted metalloprotease